jgi:hypothetical protein
MPSTSKLSITQHSPQYWRVTFDNPPINLIDPEMIVALHELLTTIEQDNRVAVVVFDSACHPPSAVSTGTGAGDAGGEHGDGCAGGRAARPCAATW